MEARGQVKFALGKLFLGCSQYPFTPCRGKGFHGEAFAPGTFVEVPAVEEDEVQLGGAEEAPAEDFLAKQLSETSQPPALVVKAMDVDATRRAALEETVEGLLKFHKL